MRNSQQHCLEKKEKVSVSCLSYSGHINIVVLDILVCGFFVIISCFTPVLSSEVIRMYSLKQEQCTVLFKYILQVLCIPFLLSYRIFNSTRSIYRFIVLILLLKRYFY